MAETCLTCKGTIESGEDVYVVAVNDTEYYCTKECLHKKYSKAEYDKMYKEDVAYYTTLE